MSDEILPGVPFVVENVMLRNMVAAGVMNLWKQVLNSTIWGPHSSTVAFGSEIAKADTAWRSMVQNVPDETLNKYSLSNGREYLKDAFLVTALYQSWPIPVTDECKRHICRTVSIGAGGYPRLSGILGDVSTVKPLKQSTDTIVDPTTMSKVEPTGTFL